jgi:hypothetical protein
MNTDKQGTVPVLPMSLFATMGSLQEVIDHAKAQLPIVNENQLMTIIGAYHNTLLKVLNERQTNP